MFFNPLLGLMKQACKWLLIPGVVVGFAFLSLGNPLAPRSEPKYEVDRLLHTIRVEDPETAATLQKLREQSTAEAFNTALLASKNINEGPASLREIARAARAANNQQSWFIDLAKLVQTIDNPEEREAFLSSYGALCLTLAELGEPDSINEFLAQVQAIRENDKAAWKVVKDDPVAVMIWLGTEDEALRKFYVNERDWLAPVLADLPIVKVDDDNDPTESAFAETHAAGLVELLEIARDFSPLTGQAVDKLELGTPGFLLFVEHGSLIKELVTNRGFNLEETLDVVYFNQPLLTEWIKEGGISVKAVADRLSKLRNGEPTIWEAARREPLAVKLWLEAPLWATTILEKNADDGAVALIYTGYPNAVKPAAEAVARFGHLAIFILAKYADSSRNEELQALLNDRQVGARVVPFLVKHGDRGFDWLHENRGRLDKEFDRDGHPKEADAWEGLPIIGAPGTLVKNWVNGYPIDASELGWAALDVAEVPLLFASFGTTNLVTAGGKAAIKGSLKQATVGSAKAARQAAIQSVKASTKALPAGTRLSAKAVGRQSGRSSLRTMLARSSKLASDSKAVVLVGLRSGQRAIVWSGRSISQAVKTAQATWRGLPNTSKRWIARGLLASALVVQFQGRGWEILQPKLAAIADTIDRNLVQHVRDLIEGFNSVANALSESPLALVWWIIPVFIVFCYWFILSRSRRRGLIYVRS